MIGDGTIKIIDFEKYLLTFCLERSKIMFFIRIVGVAKIIVDRDGLDDAGDGFLTEGCNAWGDYGMASGQLSAQCVIERAYAFGPGIHG